jgi:protoporphyrin/coproporphyrin ferrochelatase
MSDPRAPVGVLVMAHGTPESPTDIAPFYTRIRRGRPPSPEQLSELERRYAAIGGTSPLNQVTAAQVAGLTAALTRRSGDRFTVAFGAKHTAPFIEDAALALRAGGRDVIGLVLTPHGSTMGSQEYFERAEAALGPEHRFHAVPPWYAEPGFVALMAARVNQALAELAPLATPPDSAPYPVIFTAHSLPERVRSMGDTYPEQLETSARLVAQAAGLSRWLVAWQSAGRTPEPWLGPDVREVVGQLGHTDHTDGVVVCPIGFVADHLEILYDIDIELAGVARHAGLRFARTASLNDDSAFMGVLADVVCAAAARCD